MSELIKEIINRAEDPPSFNGDGPDPEANRRQLHVVRKAVGKDRETYWGSMVYACAGSPERRPLPDELIAEAVRAGHIKSGEEDQYRQSREATPPCGFEHRVWLGLGVEGPSALKSVQLTIPCPFYCGTCPECGGGLHHVRWQDDEQFEPTTDLPDGQASFVVPGKATVDRNHERGYWGAEYRKGVRA